MWHFHLETGAGTRHVCVCACTSIANWVGWTGKQCRTQPLFILLDDLVWGWLLFGGGLYSRKYSTFTCTCTCKCWILAIPRCQTYNCTFLWTVSTRLSTNKWYCLSHWKRLWMSSRFHLELGVTNVFGGVWPTGLCYLPIPTHAWDSPCMWATLQDWESVLSYGA